MESQIPADELVHRILDGNEHIVSHTGTSQYEGGAGISACGLAALNFARVMLAKVDAGQNDILQEVIARQIVVKDITSICAGWSDNFHLDVEDICRIPLFEKSLKLQKTAYGRPSIEEFKNLLRDLQTIPTSCVVIITRPPEIVACLKLTISDKNIFVIFDSHPRPNHPNGAGLIINRSIDTTADRLSQLLPVDDRLLSNRDLQWQAQLLANYSGHIFVSRNLNKSPEHLTQTVVQSSLTILALRAEVSDLKFQNSTLTSENKRLEVEMEQMEDEHREERRKLIQSSRNYGSSSRHPAAVAGPSRNTPHDSHQRTPNSRSLVSSTPSHSHPHNRYDSDLALAEQTQVQWIKYDGDVEAAAEKQRVFDEEDRCLRSQMKFLVDTGPPRYTPHDSHQSPPNSSPIDGSLVSSTPSHNHPPKQYDSDSMLAEQTQLQWIKYDADADAAAQRQREFDEEDQRLRAQMMGLMDTAQRQFQCRVCLEDHPEDFVCRLDPCGHPFCRVCVKDYVGAKLTEHRFPVLCPVCITEGDKSNPSTITNVLAQQVGITEEQHQTWVEMELAVFSVLLHCRKCKRSVFVDKQDLKDMKVIVCPLPDCNYIWCTACQQSITLGGPQHSCDGSSELNHLMKKRGWKYCPSCKTPIAKDTGCNHMTCMSPGCNTHFCYICGNAIIRSALAREVSAATSDHYRRCKLFEDVADRDVPP